ncbi:class I SAM-dependent DNA methyltransferase [Puniceibacterium confluentis]|uniref:class I SAM-dependent DNA methyltransferase n=1 Tax=Puniceibacterium confluentis TaxID=1958944 RepID=UPI0011B722F3|nr:methyltransferase domain-containing protein [Puniceibacterium confluentis]
MADTFLDKVYGATPPENVCELYDAWAPSYDAEVTENGYATPARAAKALAQHLASRDVPILDYGCGTGLCGVALQTVGFKVIDGCDISTQMLARATDKAVYRTLDRVDFDAPPDIAPGTYAAITAIGVMGAGAAPISLLDGLMSKLAKGGKLVFSQNDLARKRRGSMARIHEHLDTGSATLLHAKVGPHLPGINLKSTIYILEKN